MKKRYWNIILEEMMEAGVLFYELLETLFSHSDFNKS